MRVAMTSFALPSAVVLTLGLFATGVAQAQTQMHTVPRQYVIQAELARSAEVSNAQGSSLNGQGMVAGGGVVVDGTRTRLAFIGGKLTWVTAPIERSIGVKWAGGQATVLKSFLTKASADPAAINDAGWVVGRAAKSTAVGASLYATLWKTASPIDLGAGADSQAEFINAQGWVLGRRFITVKTPAGSVSTSEPFLWRQGKLERLNAYPDGITGMGCRGLSDTGVAACMGSAPDTGAYSGTSRWPYLWANGVYQPVNHAGAQDVEWGGISSNGIVSGNFTLQGQQRAFVWRNGQFTLLPQVGFTVLAPTSQGLLRAYRRFLTPESPYVHQEQHQLWSVSGDAVDVRELVVASGEQVVAVADLNDQGQLLAAVRPAVEGATARMVVLSPVSP